jgi:hypothetical protein
MECKNDPMKTLTMILTSLMMMYTGCDHLVSPDRTPPLTPTGVWTETGDRFIEVFWRSNIESDLAGYNIYVSSTYDGRYEWIATTSSPYFQDSEVLNGSTYYYAITAFDVAGNESELSRDVAYDVPRPEGYNVMLRDYRLFPALAGYDFSSYAVRSYNDLYTDMYFEHFNGDLYLNVRSDSDIKDMGATQSLLDVRVAPSSGWSPTGDVLLRVGHTYVVWTWDDHYAKIRVTELSPGRVVFDWAYQLQKSNPMLKRNVSQERQHAHEERRR